MFSWRRKVFQRPLFELKPWRRIELKPWRKTGRLLRRSRVKKGLARRDDDGRTRSLSRGASASDWQRRAAAVGSSSPLARRSPPRVVLRLLPIFLQHAAPGGQRNEDCSRLDFRGTFSKLRKVELGFLFL